MPFAAFTVDVDRDVNEYRPGQLEACTRHCALPRHSSSARGLELLVGLLDDLGIKGTFFLEGELVERWGDQGELKDLLSGHEVGSHGYAHEDLTGESTGVVPSQDWIDAIMGRSLAVIEDAFGRRPVGFRAPYQHLNEDVMEVLARRGLAYDSSIFAEAGRSRPYPLANGMIEVPLAQGVGPDGRRMQSYLWPMHEGRRNPADYIHLLSQQGDGVMVLADHSWHVVESLGGPRTDAGVEREVGAVRAVLEGMLDRGAEFMTLETYVAQGRPW